MATKLSDENECKLCIKERVEAGENPYKLIVLPVRTSQNKLPVRVCPNCDGDVLEYALRNI